MEQIGLAAARVVEGVVKRHMRVEELTEQGSIAVDYPATVVLIGVSLGETIQPHPTRTA